MARAVDWTRQHPRITRGFLLIFTFLVAFAAGGGYGAWALVCREGRCPSIDVLDDYTPRQTSKLYAVDGRFIAEIGLERRTLIRLGDVPRHLRDAFVITEDKRFYDHHGIDWRRVFGAGLKNVAAGEFVQGFSTITMQLARNVFPERISREKTLVRKLKEVKVARAIEAKYAKDKILELYLNQIYLGSGAYGVETAAQRYFGKSARDVTVAEAATMAALPKAPNRYNPRQNPTAAVERRNTVIELMRRNDALSDADASLAKAFPLQLALRSESGEIAPYYVEWVRQQLDTRFGRQLYEQGLRVYTTLDLDMQSAAERAMEKQLREIESGKFGPYRHPTYDAYMSRNAAGQDNAGPNSPYLQGAFIALDPRNGSIRALVGGRNFDDSKFNRATQALRQPGSTFKPIVYADAIRNGRPPSYLVDDSPLAVPQLDGETWTPQNYDLKFHGQMSIREALYQSRNLAAIRLGMELGEPSVIEMSRRFGITSEIQPYPAIHIGSASVYPMEMVAAFSAFANLGTRSAPNAILRVENARGEVLWAPTALRSPVLSPEEAWIVVDMMKDVVRRGTAFSSVYARGFTIPSAGKTGTTNDGNDVWYIGYTADLVAGVWVGLDKPQKIKDNAQGGVLAAPAWTAFMLEVYQRKPAPPDWPRPEVIISRSIDQSTGLLENPFCPREVVHREFFLPGTEPIRECDVHTPFSQFQTDSLGIAIPPTPPPDPGVGARIVPGGVPVPQPSRLPPDSNPFRVNPPTTPPPGSPPVTPPPPPVTPPPTPPPPTGGGSGTPPPPVIPPPPTDRE